MRKRMDFNYYRRLTRMYLGDYNDMKDSVALWESERNGIETELSSGGQLEV